MTKESQNKEWKELWRDEYLKWICGFANADGGRLIIGKNDKGEVVGVKNARELLELLHTKYLKAYISYEGIQRVEKFLYPKAALREAVLNAVIHKDYSSGIPIQISVYDDKIVLWNAGQLPQGWSLKNLMGKHASKPANPLVANAFFRAGYIESWGRGIEKIGRACREHDIPPPIYDFDMSGLMLTFQANPAHLPQVTSDEESSGKSSGKTSNRIIEIIKKNQNVTIPEIAEFLGFTTRAIEKQVRQLKADGCLKRVGPAKGGRWEVIKTQ